MQGVPISPDYLKELAKRGKESHVYKAYQLAGLEVSEILNDEKHKSLYIKLAKEHGTAKIMRIAKEVAEQKGVKNKGAYFMAILGGNKKQEIKNKKEKEEA